MAEGTDSTSQPTNKLTLWAAIKDLGFFPSLLMSLGGFSILAIVEQGVYGLPLDLIAPLRTMLDGYHRTMALMGAVVEPLVKPAIDWLGGWQHLDLTLDTVWRPLFALAMVLVGGVVQGEQIKGRIWRAITL